MARHQTFTITLREDVIQRLSDLATQSRTTPGLFMAEQLEAACTRPEWSMVATAADLSEAKAALDRVQDLHRPMRVLVLPEKCVEYVCAHPGDAECPSRFVDACVECLQLVSSVFEDFDDQFVPKAAEWPCATAKSASSGGGTK